MKIAKIVYLLLGTIFAILLARIIGEPDDYVSKIFKIIVYGIPSALFFFIAFKSKDIF